MLRTRVLTGLVMIAVVIAALAFLDTRGWALAVLVLFVGAFWEWGRFAKLTGNALWAYVFISVALALGLFLMGVGEQSVLAFTWLYGIATVFWALAVPVLLAQKIAVPTGWVLGVIGWIVLLPAWAAIAQGRLFGPLALFLLMGLTWIADIAAYFAGRAFGKKKLAPSISPGKTWAGVVGAVCGVLLLAVICTYVAPLRPNFYATLVDKHTWLIAFPVVVALVAVSVMGDLLESLLKRRVGMKDSSQLLPGHGGVLDRIDALIATMPVALFIGSVLALW